MDEFQESIKLRNLYKALRKCCAGSMWKDGTALYRSDGLANSVKLRRSFLDGSYKLQRYMRFRIARPKPRDITATRIRDRHGQRSACDNVLYAKITRSFIYDNGACQINKGVDFTIERTKRWLRRIYLKQRSERAKALGCRPEEVGPFQVEAWVWKGDVKKYFPSTPHANAKAILRKTIDSPELAAIFCAVIASFGEDWWRQRAAALGAGDQTSTQAAKAITDALVEREYLPIRPAGRREAIRRRCDRQIVAAVDGLRELTPQARAQLLAEAQAGEARGIGLGSQLSQLVQLAQLSAIDHYAKEERRVPVYERYMDDFNAMDESRERLTETVDGIVERLHERGLELNPKSQMIPLRNGFTFLKWHFILTPTGKVILRAAHGVAAEEKRRLRRMMKQVHAGKASLESVQAHYRGWRAHMEIGNTRELLRGMDKYFAALIAAENKESEGEP